MIEDIAQAVAKAIGIQPQRNQGRKQLDAIRKAVASVVGEPDRAEQKPSADTAEDIS